MMKMRMLTSQILTFRTGQLAVQQNRIGSSGSRTSPKEAPKLPSPPCKVTTVAF